MRVLYQCRADKRQLDEDEHAHTQTGMCMSLHLRLSCITHTHAHTHAHRESKSFESKTMLVDSYTDHRVVKKGLLKKKGQVFNPKPYTLSLHPTSCPLPLSVRSTNKPSPSVETRKPALFPLHLAIYHMAR